MSQFKVGRSSSPSMEAPIQYPDEMPRSKSSSVGETTHQHEKPTQAPPSEAVSKKREIDAEGKAQQARLENQFRKNPVVDAAKKLVIKKDFDEKDLQNLVRILQNASKENIATILNEAKKWSPTAGNLVLAALQTVLGDEKRAQEALSNVNKLQHDIPKSIIEKIR